MASSASGALHLLSLHPSTSVASFLSLVRASASSSAPFEPIFVAHAHHIIHRPRSVTRSELLSNRFDLVVVLPTAAPTDTKKELDAFPFTDSLRALVSAHMVLAVLLPEHALDFLPAKPRASFHTPTYELPRAWTDPANRPPETEILDEETAGKLPHTISAMTPSLANWLRDFGALEQGQGAVTILTLASCTSGESDEFVTFRNEVLHGLGYQRGARGTSFALEGREAFESSLDRILGGGSVADKTDGTDALVGSWTAVEIAKWPSIWYWAEMVASKEYMDLGHKHGMFDGALQDKAIICLTDLHVG